MSHNVRLSHIRFTNLDVLRAAVRELQGEGVKIELEEGPGLVARSSQYAGGDIPCDMRLRAEGHQWDVGFVREEGTPPAYVPHLESDFRFPGLSAEGQPVEGCRVDWSHIALGRLEQRYAVLTAEINAAQAGLSVERNYNASTKQFELAVL